MFDRLDEEQNVIQQREIEDFSREKFNQPSSVSHRYSSSDELREDLSSTKPTKKREQQVSYLYTRNFQNDFLDPNPFSS